MTHVVRSEQIVANGPCGAPPIEGLRGEYFRAADQGLRQPPSAAQAGRPTRADRHRAIYGPFTI